MHYDQLKTFQMTAKLLNYSRAAEQLNITQPTVTARIQNLENDLDCKFFQKNGKNLSLTKEAKQILPMVDKVLLYMTEIRQAVELSKRQKIKLGLSPAFSLPTILRALSILQFEHQISVSIAEGQDSGEIAKMVVNGEADVGLIRDVISFPDLESQYIYSDKLIFIVGKHHPLAKKETVTKHDLAGHTMVCYLRHTPIGVKIDERLVGVHNLNRVEVGSFELVRSMLRNGWGFSIIPELANWSEIVSSEEENKDLLVIPFEEMNQISFNVMGIYKKDSPSLENLQLLLSLFQNILHSDHGLNP